MRVQSKCCRWWRDCQNVFFFLSQIIAPIMWALCQSKIIYIWEGIVLDSKSNQAISHSDQMSQAARFILKAEKWIRTPGYCILLQHPLLSREHHVDSFRPISASLNCKMGQENNIKLSWYATYYTAITISAFIKRMLHSKLCMHPI